jgi:hypothetical protein
MKAWLRLRLFWLSVRMAFSQPWTWSCHFPGATAFDCFGRARTMGDAFSSVVTHAQGLLDKGETLPGSLGLMSTDLGHGVYFWLWKDETSGAVVVALQPQHTETVT